jgi:group II intron reverse transcriptase/maturase
MRDADTVLGIIHARGQAGLPLEDIYRQLYNPRLYLRAYDRLRQHDGALTPGTTEETVDGMSLAKIEGIIEALRFERFRWTPVKRVYIPKSNGRLRPLGLPTWTDKLLQEVMRSILDAYYEPQFSPHSHGFRTDHGCHTALMAVQRTWKGTKWFIEGDITKCFDMLDHTVLIRILGEKLHDNRFLQLIESMLKAGYLENWHWHTTHSGSPQGGVISPILANIYLDRLDQYVTNTLLPQFNQGEQREKNPVYERYTWAIDRAKRKGNRERYRALVKERRNHPCGNPYDPDYRRLQYVRYADDFLLGFAGPRTEAEDIKRLLKGFLEDELQLELSSEKTLITHAQTDTARFLGYEIRAWTANDKISANGQRNVNGVIGLYVPKDVQTAACQRYMRKGKPVHRTELLHDSDYSIMMKYQLEYRGLVQYYMLATNVSDLNHLHYIMRTSLAKTLAAKHKTRVSAILGKYSTTTDTTYGAISCLTVKVPRPGKPPLVATFGGIPLRRKKTASLHDNLVSPGNWRNTDIVKRLLADTCELCGSKVDIQVHHIRKLSELHQTGRREKPDWMKRMIVIKRKTLVVCRHCHWDIHTGRPLKRTKTGEPGAAKVASPVRRGADGKGPNSDEQ